MYSTSARITYFDASQLWCLFEQNISDSFPLVNVGSSSSNKKTAPLSRHTPSPALVSFPLVNVSFEPYSSDLLSGSGYFDRHRRPMVHLFLASCEDIDVYRTDVRPKLVSWLESMPNRRSLKLIVILIEKIPFSVEGSKSSKAFLLDKIRFDFGDKAALNVISMKHQTDGLLSGVPEFIELLSDCLFSAASSQLELLDEEIRKIDSQRNVPGWNYCSFFIAKEEKALLSLSLGLPVEALLAYDELEAVYYQIAESFQFRFESILPPREVISGQDLFVPDGKPYRDLIYRNEISFYDFGVYLFSRQALILSHLKKYSEFVSRTKRFVCSFSPLSSVPSHQRAAWIFDSIVSAFRYLHKFHSDALNTITVELSDLLLLAESQLLDSHETGSSSTSVIPELNFSQFPYFSEIEKFYDFATHKISLLRWCKSMLSHGSSNWMTCMLRLMKQYFAINLFYDAAECSDEIVTCLEEIQWPGMKIQVYEQGYRAHKKVGSDKKFVQYAFEYLTLCTESSIECVEELKEINTGLQRISDDVCLDFDAYFSIDNLKFNETEGNSISLFISSLLDLSEIPFTVKITFSGEESDLDLQCTNVLLSAQSNEIVFPIKNSELASGTFKLQGIVISSGKVSWHSNKLASSERPFEVNLSPFKDIDFVSQLPDEFDFSNPSIVLKARTKISITELNISAFSADFTISTYSSEDLMGQNELLFTLKASRFAPGEHKIKIIAAYTTPSGQIRRLQVWHSVTFPAAWKAEARMLKLNDSSIISLSIYPQCDQVILLKSILLGDRDEATPYNHSISHSSDPIYFSSTTDKCPEFVTVHFETALNNGVSSYKIPVKMIQNKTKRAYCRPLGSKDKAVIGVPVHMVAKVDVNEPVSFVIDYDPSCWMISGVCSGQIKGSFEFDAIPIKTGPTILPTLLFPKDQEDIHNSSLGSIIRCVDQ